LHSDSCFVLTDLGHEFACAFADYSYGGDPNEMQWLKDLVWIGPLPPKFNTDERRLEWGRHLIKCFRQPAQNQELILKAAQELYWPSWFDDPLPRVPWTSAKKRLHDTIQDLNRRQQSGWIKFVGDGTGTRVGWHFR
jgi:hypothetical protein